MASQGFKYAIGVCVAGSMMFSSTAALASMTAPVAQPSPWAVLTAMSGGAPAAAMCGGAQASGGCVLPALGSSAAVMEAAAAQEAPPPPESAPPQQSTISPLLIALIAIAAGVGFYLVIHNSGHANSPA